MNSTTRLRSKVDTNCTAKYWRADKAYSVGTCVLFNGHTWQATSWNINREPISQNVSAWQLVQACSRKCAS